MQYRVVSSRAEEENYERCGENEDFEAIGGIFPYFFRLIQVFFLFDYSVTINLSMTQLNFSLTEESL